MQIVQYVLELKPTEKTNRQQETMHYTVTVTIKMKIWKPTDSQKGIRVGIFFFFFWSVFCENVLALKTNFQFRLPTSFRSQDLTAEISP